MPPSVVRKMEPELGPILARTRSLSTPPKRPIASLIQSAPGPVVMPLCMSVQLPPPFVVRKTPEFATPANSRKGFAKSMTTSDTWPSSTFDHVCPPFVDLCKPPVPATYTTSGLFGWTTTRVQRVLGTNESVQLAPALSVL
jgi:hypothetical protein